MNNPVLRYGDPRLSSRPVGHDRPLRIGGVEALIILVVSFLIWGFWSAAIITIVVYLTLNWVSQIQGQALNL